MLSKIEQIHDNLFSEKGISVYLKRDDLIHPYISGNKYRKLIYALNHIKDNNIKTVLTFGGAFSNHIHAFSYAAKINGIKSIGIIRGEELKNKPLNDTLLFAKENEMEFIFVSREEYKKRYDQDYLNQLAEKYNAYIIPEGGTQSFSKYGLLDMMQEINKEKDFDYICSACGTGGTFSGIVSGLNNKQKGLGFLVLKGIENDIISKIKEFSDNKNYELISDYHFNGYAKYNDELISFINYFKLKHNIQLEQVYTGKMMYGFYNMVKNDFFKRGDQICLVHTGGIQGLLKTLL